MKLFQMSEVPYSDSDRDLGPRQVLEDPDHSYGSYVGKNLSNSSFDPVREQEL